MNCIIEEHNTIVERNGKNEDSIKIVKPICKREFLIGIAFMIGFTGGSDRGEVLWTVASNKIQLRCIGNQYARKMILENT